MYPISPYMPCPECGQSVFRPKAAQHVCDPEKKVSYEMFQLREEIESFEESLVGFLESPEGRFAQYMAERARLET